MDSLFISRRTFVDNSHPSYRGGNPTEEKLVLEKLKSLRNWLNERNFENIKDEILKTIRGSPSAINIKALVCCIFDMAMVDNAYVLFARLCVELFHQLPPFRSDESHGELTTFERLFLCRCRMELEKSSPTTDRPPLFYVEESNFSRFVKTVRFLAEVFKNRVIMERTRKSIIQVLMDPISPSERNIDAMNLFLYSIGKLSEFQLCDESFKQILQSSRELESKYNEEVRLRKEAEDKLARKGQEVDTMERLLVSYQEEQEILRLQTQALEQKHKEELHLRKETEYALAIEQKRMEKLKLRLQNLEIDHENMRLKAEEFESKYKDERILRKESEIVLEKERIELEEIKGQLETCKVEEENLTSQVRTLQDKFEEELSVRKETEEARSREKEELEIVKGLLESYGFKTVQELTRKQSEKREPPNSFLCPITQDVMKDPHFTADGFTYEAEAIRRWFNTGYDTSPMTHLKLPHRNLVPNWALRSAIEDWV